MSCVEHFVDNNGNRMVRFVYEKDGEKRVYATMKEDSFLRCVARKMAGYLRRCVIGSDDEYCD